MVTQQMTTQHSPTYNSRNNNWHNSSNNNNAMQPEKFARSRRRAEVVTKNFRKLRNLLNSFAKTQTLFCQSHTSTFKRRRQIWVNQIRRKISTDSRIFWFRSCQLSRRTVRPYSCWITGLNRLVMVTALSPLVDLIRQLTSARKDTTNNK